MAEFIKEGDMIEGAKCNIYARKLLPKRLEKDPITNEDMKVFELDLNCSVEVTQELPLDDVDKSLRDDNNIHGKIGDKLKADAIRLFVDRKCKRLKIEVKEGATSRHGASLTSTDKRTIGFIKHSFKMYETLFWAKKVEIKQVK